MKKFFIILLLIVFIAVGGLITLVALSFNPTTYEKQVIATLGQLTGRTVKIGSGSSVVWNPVPTITLHDVRLSNINKSQSPDMLTIEQVKVTIAWSSLLKTPFVIKSVELQKPILSLERLENNKTNFEFDFLFNPNFQPQSLNLLSDNKQPSATKIDQILIKEGQIIYQNDLTGLHLMADNINGTLSARSAQGPFTFKGTTLWKDRTLSVQADTGVFQSINPIPATFKLEEKSLGVFLNVDGNYTPARVDQFFEGGLNLSVKNVNSFIEFLGIDTPQFTTDKSFNLSSSIIITPTTDTLKNFVFTFGEGEQSTALTGTLTRTLRGTEPSYTLDIAADTFNPADFQGLLPKVNWDLLKQSDLPKTTFAIQVKTLPFSKTQFQNIALKGKLESGALTLEQADVLLPGQTDFKASGAAAIVSETPTITLSTQLSTEKLTEFYTWFKKPALFFPNAIKKADFEGKIILTPTTTTYQINSLKLDDATLSGQIVEDTTDKPLTQIKLSASNLNVDKIINWTAPKEMISLSSFPLTLKQVLEQATWVHNMGIQGSLSLNDSTLFGMPVGQGSFEGSLENDILTLNKIDIKNMATANLSGSLKINGLGKPQLNVDQLSLSLDAQQLPLLLQRAHINSTLPLIQKSAQAKTSIQLNGGRDGVWQSNISGSVSDVSFKLAGQFTGLETHLRADNMTFDIAHPHFQTLMTALDPNWTSLPKLDGTFKAQGKLTGSADHLAIQDSQFAVGLQKIEGNINFDNQSQRALTAVLSSPSFDLNRVLPSSDSLYSAQNDFSQKKFDFSAFNDWKADITLKTNQLLYQDLNIRNADINLSLNDKELSLNRLSGQNGDNPDSPIDLTAKLNWTDTPYFMANFKADALPLRSDFMVMPDIAFGTGTVSLSGEIKTHGNSLAEFIQSLNGKGNISFQKNQFIGVNVMQMVPVITRAIQQSETPKEFEPEFNRVLHSGKTAVSEITGDFAIADGIVRMMDLSLRATDSTANPTQIIWDLPKKTLEVSIPVVLNPFPNLPPFILGISVNDKGGQYQPSYTDLSMALGNQSKHALENTLKQQQEAATKAATQKRSDRIAESKEMTQKARTSLAEMEQLFKSFPFETGNRLLQSARDAMSLVNQLSILEEPTDAQLIQQIEQSRIVLLKAEEFHTALEQESAFNTQKTITAIQEKANQEVAALQKWADEHPDISLLGKLAQNATQNRIIIEQMAMGLKKELPQDQVEKALLISQEALSKIDKAYQHAARFDLSSTETPQTNQSATLVQDTQSAYSTGDKKAMRGSFNRNK